MLFNSLRSGRSHLFSNTQSSLASPIHFFQSPQLRCFARSAAQAKVSGEGDSSMEAALSKQKRPMMTREQQNQKTNKFRKQFNVNEKITFSKVLL